MYGERDRILDMLQHLRWAVAFEGADPQTLQTEYDRLLAQLDCLGPAELQHAAKAA